MNFGVAGEEVTVLVDIDVTSRGRDRYGYRHWHWRWHVVGRRGVGGDGVYINH